MYTDSCTQNRCTWQSNVLLNQTVTEAANKCRIATGRLQIDTKWRPNCINIHKILSIYPKLCTALSAQHSTAQNSTAQHSPAYDPDQRCPPWCVRDLSSRWWHLVQKEPSRDLLKWHWGGWWPHCSTCTAAASVTCTFTITTFALHTLHFLSVGLNRESAYNNWANSVNGLYLYSPPCVMLVQE